MFPHRDDVIVAAQQVDHLSNQFNLGLGRSTHRGKERKISVVFAAHEIQRMQQQRRAYSEGPAHRQRHPPISHRQRSRELCEVQDVAGVNRHS